MPTEADRELAEKYWTENWTRPLDDVGIHGPVVSALAKFLAWSREQEQSQSKPAEPPLPDKLPAHCFAVYECEHSSITPVIQPDARRMLFRGVKRRIPLPPGSVVFVATGEFREPLPGEWFEGTNGLVALNESSCFGAKRKIVHRIEVTK